jgi:hypothetical protein
VVIWVLVLVTAPLANLSLLFAALVGFAILSLLNEFEEFVEDHGREAQMDTATTAHAVVRNPSRPDQIRRAA